MEVNCAGCAGCCLDWRPLVDEDVDHERRSPWKSLDDTHNLVALERDEIRAFLEAGLGDALTVRLWEAAPDREEALEIDGHRIASVAGRPVFFIGLRKPPKPVAPFGLEDPVWLPTCVFLDPTTLQCRIHGDDLYPDECGEYPAHNLALEVETECERVENAFGGDRLVDDDPGETEGLLLGPQAIGQKVFVHPNFEALDGVVDRAARGILTREDRAEFVAIAAASSPATFAVSDHYYEEANTQALEADSWVGQAVEEWEERSAGVGEAVASGSDTDVGDTDTDIARAVEDARGAPETPGWDDGDATLEDTSSG